ncbi:MAG: secretin and TonB N-terminal domain-containing protein [Bdellovibrionaceae bacterium]|nr:secretin and TonB N-terminal domain-containing protein [Pseudobdellovibrionaceae bacterium]
MKELFRYLRTRCSASWPKPKTLMVLLLLLLVVGIPRYRSVYAEDASDELESLMEDGGEEYEEYEDGYAKDGGDDYEYYDDEGELANGEKYEEEAAEGGEKALYEEDESLYADEEGAGGEDEGIDELLADETETELDGEDQKIRSVANDKKGKSGAVEGEDAEIDALLGDDGDEFAEDEGAGEEDAFDQLVEAQKEKEQDVKVYGENQSKGAEEPISYGRAVVGSLDFKMEGSNSRIVMGFNGRPRYEQVDSPETNQIVYLFQNTESPDKFQRAYDTREFQSPVGLFTMLQLPEAAPSTKLIVQLREPSKPRVFWEGSNFVIEFQPPKNKYQSPGVPSALSQGALSAQLGTNNYIEENIYAIDRVFTGRPIERLEIKDSDIQDVLRLIAKTSGYNIVIGEDVSGKIGTLSLKNIPWDQAFTLVLQSKRLGYIRQGNVLRVATLSSLKSEKDAAVANEKAKLAVQSLRTVLIPVSYADSAELAGKAKPFLTDRGKIDTDARTNTIIVRDIKSVTERVQKLLAALDTQPPRVSISAKIVEMVDTFTRQIGFSSLGANGSISGVNLDNDFVADIQGFNTTTIRAPQFANLQMDFQLGQLENKVRILANPQVTAVNNQKATVTQSVTQFLQESVTAGGTQTTTFKEIKANLSLAVTPIVSGDGAVFMKVNVTNEVPTGPPTDKQIDTRQVSTQVLVANGDTAVIGGIYNSTRTNAVQGIPWLMKIPILGFFVSNQSEEESRNEILVFLTPKILNAEESFKRAL